MELNDEEYTGGDNEEIGVEGAEAESFEGQGQVVCWRCLKEVRGVDEIDWVRDEPWGLSMSSR